MPAAAMGCIQRQTGFLPITFQRLSASRRGPVTPDPARASRAKRCLFGPVDHSQLQNIQNEQFEAIRMEQRSKWNFDFEAEKPLISGQYEWIRVEEDSGPTQSRLEKDSKALEQATKDSSTAFSCNNSSSQPSATYCVQSKITAFMRSRKRPFSETKLSEQTADQSDSSSSKHTRLNMTSSS